MSRLWTSSPDDDVWALVMFDLPVKTAPQRREATRFRKLLLDQGFLRAQYSVYVRFTPRVAGSRQVWPIIRANLPPGGEVRLLHVTDRQWATAQRFWAGEPASQPPEPQQLTIF